MSDRSQPTGAGEGPDVESLLQSLSLWAAEERDDRARARRIADRWHEQVLAESVRLTGLLRDLMERTIPLTITTESGRSHSGTVALVGSDFCAVADSAGPLVFVVTGSITSVLVESPARTVAKASDRDAPNRTPSLFDLLTNLSSERARVRLVLRGSPDVLSGEIRSTGDDVITIVPDERASTTVVVPTSGLTEVWINR